MTRIAIAGAGIGGLTAGLCLHARGFTEVRIFEAVPEIRPLGVGINVMPHASEVLHGLGRAGARDALAGRTPGLADPPPLRPQIQFDPRDVEAGYAAPQYSIHRGELQLLLLDAVRARLGPDAVAAGRPVAGFAQTGDAVTVLFQDGSTHEADLLVGAEGLRSRLRAQLHPNEGPLRYEGTMMFRGASETDVIGDGRTMVIAGNHDVKFVTYPISERHRRQGKALTNWVAEVRVDRPRHIQDADWSRGATLDYLTPFAAFRMGDMDVTALMRAAPAVTEFPMVDRDPLPFWTLGRVTLLGDAAHPMYPIGANGASQAIMDGRALADALAADPGPGALRAYEAARRPVTERVVLMNRAGGPERVLDIADARVKGPEDRIEDLITADELDAVATAYRAAAGFRKRTA